MGYHRAGIGQRIDALDRAGDADLLSHQLVQARLEATVPDQERRGDDLVALGANRNTDSVIVGQRIGQRAEAADAIEHRPPQRDGGATARLRQAETDRGDGLRKELRVDGERRKPRPYALPADAVIEAGHGADAAEESIAVTVRR